MLRKLIPLSLASAGLALSAPLLFVGFDRPGQGTTNSDAARAAFTSYLNGAATESFEGLNPANYVSYVNPIPMVFNGFTGGISPADVSPLKGTGAFSTIGGGNNFIYSEPAGWGIDFSTAVSGLGFSLRPGLTHLSPPGDPISSAEFTLFLDTQAIVISPYDYGLAAGDDIEWGFIGVIDLAGFTHASYSQYNVTDTKFRTDMFIAADATQLVPEPGTWTMALAGLALTALRLIRR